MRRAPKRSTQLGLLALAGLLALGWTLRESYVVEERLTAAKAALTSGRAQVLDGDPAARQTLAGAAADTKVARDAVRNPVFSLVAHLPYVGRPFRTIAGIAEVSDELARRSLPRLVDASAGLTAVRKASSSDLPLGELSRLATPLTALDRDLQRQVYGLEHLPSSPRIGPLENARTTLLRQLRGVAGPVHTAAVAARIAPAMLGAGPQKHYLLVFEQPAEARPDGGLIGGWGELSATNGRLVVEQFGPNSTLPRIAPGTPVQLDPDFRAAYGRRGAGESWVNTNLSPDFGQDAQAWAAMYAAVRRPVDGVIALDPEALGAIAGLTGGAVTVPGAGQVQPPDLPRFLLEGQYALPIKKNQRKDLLGSVGQQVLDRLRTRPVAVRPLLTTLGHLAGGGHLKLWSNDPVAQGQLAGFPIARTVPDTAAAYTGVFASNSLGSKLDAYLQESVTRQQACTRTTSRVTVTVLLRNDLPAGALPSYVTVGDIPRPKGIPVGTSRIALTILATRGADLTAATVDGVGTYDLSKPQDALPPGAATVEPISVNSHPGWRTVLDVPGHGSRTVVLHLDEPVVGGPARVQVQALARPATVTNRSC